MIFTKKLLLPLLMMASPLSHAIVAGGIISVDHSWPSKAEFNKLSFFQQISNDGGKDARYYWANQFYFKKGDVGYIGLQNRGNGVHAFNYSIWKAKGWKGGQCSYFDHEGSGVQCQVVIPWKTGHQYQLDVSRNGNLVSGVVTDLMDGTTTTVGVIEVPSTFGKIYSSSGFVEEYSQGSGQLSSCNAISAQASVFKNPVGDDKTEARQSTFTYGNCDDASVVQAACNDDACINTISHIGSVALLNSLTIEITNDEDLSEKTLSDGLKKANMIVIRTEDGGWTPNIYFPKASTAKSKSIFVEHRASYGTSIHVNDAVKQFNKGQRQMYISDGNSWKATTPD